MGLTFDASVHEISHALSRQGLVAGAEREIVNRLAVTLVARQHFVAAFAGQNHLDVLGGEARNEIQRDARRMRERFVFVPDEARQRVEELFGADDDFVMIGFESSCGETRVSEFVGLALREGDGESFDRLINHAAHHGSYC